MTQTLQLDQAKIAENKQKYQEFFDGGRQLLINLFWNDERPYCPQTLEYESYEAAAADRIGHLNNQMEAALAGFDNVPQTAFFGGTAYMMASAYGCPIRAHGDLMITTPGYVLGEVPETAQPEQHGFYAKLFSYLERFQSEYPDAPLSICDNQTPIDVFNMLYSVEDAMYMLYDYPAESKAVLQNITDNIIRINRMQEAAIGNFTGFGAGGYWPRGIFFSNDDAAYLSPEIYRTFALPYDNMLSREFGGISYHVCMKYEQNIPSLTSAAGFVGFDCMPYYNDPHLALSHLRPQNVWSLCNWPWTIPDWVTEPVLDFYIRMLDLARGKAKLRLDIHQNKKEDAIALAQQVRTHALATGWEEML